MKQLRGIVYVFTQNKLPTIARDEEEIGFPISERRGGVKNQPWAITA